MNSVWGSSPATLFLGRCPCVTENGDGYVSLLESFFSHFETYFDYQPPDTASAGDSLRTKMHTPVSIAKPVLP
jgi:hypothetical protein